MRDHIGAFTLIKERNLLQGTDILTPEHANDLSWKDSIEWRGLKTVYNLMTGETGIFPDTAPQKRVPEGSLSFTERATIKGGE